MSRLIDADAFAEFITDCIKRHHYEDLKLNHTTMTVSDVLDAVMADIKGTGIDGFKNAPTVDAVSVVHGHWVKDRLCTTTITGEVTHG